MRYLLAIFLPPLAVLVCKKPLQFVVNLLIWLVSLPLLFFMGVGVFIWLLCSVHALIVCSNTTADRRVERLVNAIQGQKAGAVPAK